LFNLNVSYRTRLVRVQYDLNLTWGCHRFYYLAPFTVFDTFSHPFLPGQCLFTLCVAWRINLQDLTILYLSWCLTLFLTPFYHVNVCLLWVNNRVLSLVSTMKGTRLLNLALGCHRFYYLAPLPVLDPMHPRGKKYRV
jgi:hypothetical protein